MEFKNHWYKVRKGNYDKYFFQKTSVIRNCEEGMEGFYVKNGSCYDAYFKNGDDVFYCCGITIDSPKRLSSLPKEAYLMAHGKYEYQDLTWRQISDAEAEYNGIMCGHEYISEIYDENEKSLASFYLIEEKYIQVSVPEGYFVIDYPGVVDENITHQLYNDLRDAIETGDFNPTDWENEDVYMELTKNN